MQFKKLMAVVISATFITNALLVPEVSQAGIFKKIERGFRKHVRNPISNTFRSAGREFRRVAKKLEQKTRQFRRTMGDIHTYGYTRHLRHKARAMAEAAYAEAMRIQMEEARYNEIQRLLEKYSYVSESASQQAMYIADLNRAISLQNIIISLTQSELSQRTTLQEWAILAKNLVDDQDQALEQLGNAMVLTYASADIEKLATDQDYIDTKNEINANLSEEDARSDEEIVNSVVTRTWDDTIFALNTLAKARNQKLSEYINEILKVSEREDLEELLKIVVTIKTQLQSLAAKITEDKLVNERYMTHIENVLAKNYNVKKPTEEELKAIAEKEKQEELKLRKEIEEERKNSETKVLVEKANELVNKQTNGSESVVLNKGKILKVKTREAQGSLFVQNLLVSGFFRKKATAAKIPIENANINPAHIICEYDLTKMDCAAVEVAVK